MDEEKNAGALEQRALARAVGRAIWRTDAAGRPAKGTAEEVQKSWTEGRREYVTQGQKLIKALNKEGVVLTPPPVTEQDAAA
jgi:hypothetical protein